jgi:phage gpG-like protein
VAGDDPKLRALIARLERVASGKLVEELRRAYVSETREQLRRAFDESRSPSGDRWPSLKTRNGKPLVDTGALRDAFDVEQTRDGVRVSNSKPYAKAHQTGFRIRRRRGGKNVKRRRAFGRGGGRVPARPMVPTSRWGSHGERALRAVATRIVRRFLRR